MGQGPDRDVRSGPCCRTGRGRSRSAGGRPPASQPTTRGGRRFSSPVTATTRAAPAASPPARSPCSARATLSGRACRASFAALCGVSPVERSSGRRQFRRLKRRPVGQRRAPPHRVHPPAGRPAHPGLLRAPDQGGQDPARNRPLPQTLRCPGGLTPRQTATASTPLIGAVTEDAQRIPCVQRRYWGSALPSVLDERLPSWTLCA